MGKCIVCGKSGMFLKLDAKGRCSDCENKKITKRLLMIEEFERLHGPILDKHYALAEKASNSYRSGDYKKTIAYCEENIDLLPKVKKAWDAGKKLKYYQTYPNVKCFKLLSQAYEKLGKYDDAIDACRRSIKAGFKSDGTQGGMSGRIKRLEKKAKPK